MLGFFSKKIYLADYLEDFVDIHNHVLPGIDDGAKNTADSLALIREYQSVGIKKIIATPHIFAPLYPNTPELIKNAHKQLQIAMQEEGIDSFEIETAAEHMIDTKFEELMENDHHMPLSEGYMLSEMSFLQPPLNFDEAMIAINRRRLTPILAHPERYVFLQRRPKKLAKLKEQGILFQINLLSLAGFYDREVEQLAWKLLDQGMVDFLGSDIHNLHHFKAIKELTLKPKRLEQLLPLIGKSIEVFY